ncbi:MAG: response regulator [Gammaproteobacteria bacterium]|nr:response regulator [Gammaproteobacteria bacterium]
MSDAENDKKPKILLADDSKVIRTSAAKILGDEFELLLAVDGQDAWEQVQQDREICVLFTDIGMPFIDGLELLGKIRQSDDESMSQLPVVVVTGDETDEAREDALSRGASDFITKPFNKVDLLARARSHAQAQQQKRELEQHSTLDRLTRLSSEPHFMDKLQEMRSFTQRHDHALSVIKIHIDNVKDTVKGFGKETFLRRLRDIGSLIKVCVRKEDTPARVEAVKFAIVLPMCDSDGALALAKRIQTTLEAGAKRSGWKVPLTLSIGVSTPSLDPDLSVDDILADIDKAVAKAEKGGPGGIELSPVTRQHLDKGERHRMTVASALKYLGNKDPEPVKAEMDSLLDRLEPLLKLAAKVKPDRLRKLLG